jgi:beta-mannosidase
VTALPHQNTSTPVLPNKLSLINPEGKGSHDAKTGPFTVEVKNGVSLYTWLDYSAGVVRYFDDNSFTLLPGEKGTARFHYTGG